MNLLNEFRSMLFLDTSQNMLNIINQKISDSNALNASTVLYCILNFNGHLLIVDFNKNEEVVSDMFHIGFDQGQLKEIKILDIRDFRDINLYLKRNF